MTSVSGDMIRLQEKWKIQVILYCFTTPPYFCGGLRVKTHHDSYTRHSHEASGLISESQSSQKIPLSVQRQIRLVCRLNFCVSNSFVKPSASLAHWQGKRLYWRTGEMSILYIYMSSSAELWGDFDIVDTIGNGDHVMPTGPNIIFPILNHNKKQL